MTTLPPSIAWWLPLAVFSLHMLEEVPRFPRWATRHFGGTSYAWYTYSHAVLVGIIFAICFGSSSGAVVMRVLWVAVAISLACNGAFHVTTTVWFREYSPGVVTGVVALFPAAIFAVFEAALDRERLLLAVVLGVISQIAVIASLWLPLDVDWRLRKKKLE